MSESTLTNRQDLPSALATSPASAPSGPPVLEISDLSHRWKKAPRPVLDDIDILLRAGEVTWIGGRNGVGKTTLLRLAAGILLPQRGSVRLDGLDSKDGGQRYRRRIGFLSAGDRSLQARMRVAQQLDYWARLAYVPRERRHAAVELALDQFGLRDLSSHRVDRMSQGQRQRIRLAMAFLHEPKLVLLDEPRNSLDDDGYALLAEQTTRAAAGGAAVLWCSPRGEDRVISCDVSFWLEDGRLEPAP